MLTKLAIKYLERKDLSQAEHLSLLNLVNKQTNAFPIDNVIKLSPDGGVLANGRKLTMDEVIKFRQGISALRDNWAFQLLGDQIFYEAIKWGIHTGDTTDKMMFSKTSIWFITKFREYTASFDLHKAE